jgi:ribosomal protein S18 acetylase RimI-like enzyme
MQEAPIQLIRAQISDIEIIHQLAEKIWWEHYPPIIGEEQVKYMLNRMYSFDELNKQISQGFQEFYLIQNNQSFSGFLSIEIDADHIEKGFINKFYIQSETRRSGIGKLAFEALLMQYPQVNEIRLQVNRQNYKAINFYFKMGFTIESVADFNIGDGYFMNDFIMLWEKPSFQESL